MGWGLRVIHDFVVFVIVFVAVVVFVLVLVATVVAVFVIVGPRNLNFKFSQIKVVV